jgi:exopolyphosphatase/guanosine-5'-triphosphate,3'-diphosphate pyrophosphatase
MAQNKYPLHVLHHYAMTRQQASAVADLVSGLSSSSLRDVREVSRSRSDTLPYGALVLDRLLAESNRRCFFRLWCVKALS